MMPLIWQCLLALAGINLSLAVDITTRYGVVRGQTVQLNTGKEINTFLGIPFMKPPVGPLRWQVPEEPTPWTEPFLANRYGSMCHQSGLLMFLTHPEYDNYSEDCIHLDIYTPNNMNTSKPYPVMVYIHGGGYVGSGSIQYPGHFLAARDVVVVVTNYRLGILGYMSTGDATVKPNLGMLDQHRALLYVQENIAAFGGDPNKVTIFGQSAGGASVGLHIVSPLSQGLFHQAISMSGSELSAWAIGSPDQNPENLTVSVAVKANCSKPTIREMVDCMRKVDGKTLTSITPDLGPESPILGFSPVVDGADGFLPDLPSALREQGKYAKVPLMAGCTTEDASIFVPEIIPEALDGGLNRTRYEVSLRNFVNKAAEGETEYRREQIYQAFHHQYTNWPHLDDLEANRQSFVNIATDFGFGYAMDAQLKHQSKESKTYMYLFGFRSTNASEVLPEWFGVPHIGDIPYFFGYPQIIENPAVRDQTGIEDLFDWNQEDLDYANYMMDLITNFAKTGDPTPQPVQAPGTNQPTTWPQFDNTNLNYLFVKRKIEIKNHYRQNNYAFWTEYLPWILTHKYPSFKMSTSEGIQMLPFGIKMQSFFTTPPVC